MKGVYRMIGDEYEVLCGRWAEVLDAISEDTEKFDLESVKHLIFDTYHFYRKELGDGDSIQRKRISLYKCVSQAALYLTAMS